MQLLSLHPSTSGWTSQKAKRGQQSIEAQRAARSEQEPVPGRKAGGLKKGLSLIYLKEFVLRQFGSSGWEALLFALDPADRKLLPLIAADEWCELDLHARVNKAFHTLFDDGSFRVVRELGRYSAERDLKTVHRWLLRLFKPSTVLKNINFYWRRGDETGHLSSIRDGEMLLIRLADWGVDEPVLCERFLGYLWRMLEYSGPVIALEHSHCRAEGRQGCEFRFRWLLTTDEVCNGILRSRVEVPRILRELDQCTELDTFADAVVRLLRSSLQCRSVTMWVKLPGSDALHVLRTSDESSGDRCHRFILEIEGHIVGRIDVEPMDGRAGSRLAKILESLLPCIASRLERLCSSRRWDAASQLTCRVEEAASKWDLSHRQRDVLRLLAEGLTNKDIAEELSCSVGTVETHVSRILAKSGADSRTMLVSWMLSSSMLSSPR